MEIRTILNYGRTNVHIKATKNFCKPIKVLEIICKTKNVFFLSKTLIRSKSYWDWRSNRNVEL